MPNKLYKVIACIRAAGNRSCTWMNLMQMQFTDCDAHAAILSITLTANICS